MDTEELLEIAKRTFNIFLLRHPSKVWAGALVGVALDVIHNILSVIILGREGGKLYPGPEWHLIVFGIFVVCLPAIYQITKSSPEFDEDTETAFRTIERARRDGMSDAHAKLMYRRLCEKAVERVTLSNAEADTTKVEPQRHD
jgi:hypothetical protein